MKKPFEDGTLVEVYGRILEESGISLFEGRDISVYDLGQRLAALGDPRFVNGKFKFGGIRLVGTFRPKHTPLRTIRTDGGIYGEVDIEEEQNRMRVTSNPFHLIIPRDFNTIFCPERCGEDSLPLRDVLGIIQEGYTIFLGLPEELRAEFFRGGASNKGSRVNRVMKEVNLEAKERSILKGVLEHIERYSRRGTGLEEAVAQLRVFVDADLSKIPMAFVKREIDEEVFKMYEEEVHTNYSNHRYLSGKE